MHRCLLTLLARIDKEVQGYYDDGLRVPDDITLLWADDKYVSSLLITISVLTCHSWGNMNRLPLPEERNRTGGAGVYYHVDYVRLKCIAFRS